MSRPVRALCMLLALALTLAACGGKSNPPKDEAKPAPPPPIAGFLGRDAALMAPVAGHEPMRAWRSDDFNAKSYKAILLDPVVLWNRDALLKESGVKPEELDALATYFGDTLKKALTDIQFPLVTAPGPGVLRVSPAIEDVRASNPVRNTISSVLPIGILISLGEKAAIGRDVNVGSCGISMRFTDATSGQTVGMFSDERQGDKYDKANFSDLGQAEKAMNAWAALIQKRILALWGAKPLAQQ